MRIGFDPQTNKIIPQIDFSQKIRVLNDDLIKKLEQESGLESGELTFTAYRSASGKTLLIVEGETCFKKFMLRPDGTLSTAFEPEDRALFKKETDFSEARHAGRKMGKFEAEIKDWENHKQEKTQEIKEEIHHSPEGKLVDAFGNEISPEKEYGFRLSDMKAALRNVKRNLALSVDPADQRTEKF